jgi:hypothetical protein
MDLGTIDTTGVITSAPGFLIALQTSSGSLAILAAIHRASQCGFALQEGVMEFAAMRRVRPLADKKSWQTFQN